MELVSAKCPNCNANLELDDELEQAKCQFCNSSIYVREAIEKERVELSGKVEIDGIITAKKLEENAQQFIEFGDFYKAQTIYEKLTDTHPEKASLWWGLIVCHTHNFTISSKLVPCKKYYERFLKTASDKEKGELIPIYENYIGIVGESNEDDPIKIGAKKEYYSSIIDFLITVYFGFFGVHKFMKKKAGMGFLYFFTLGLFGIGWIYDSFKAGKNMFVTFETYKNSLNLINSKGKFKL